MYPYVTKKIFHRNLSGLSAGEKGKLVTVVALATGAHMTEGLKAGWRLSFSLKE